MTKAQKRENALHSSAAPSEQKSLHGSELEGSADSPNESIESPTIWPRGPPPKMLRFSDVIAATGLSRTTVWRRIREGSFPAPISLGKNSVGWPEPAITAWLQSRPLVAYAPKGEAA